MRAERNKQVLATLSPSTRSRQCQPSRGRRSGYSCCERCCCRRTHELLRRVKSKSVVNWAWIEICSRNRDRCTCGRDGRSKARNGRLARTSCDREIRRSREVPERGRHLNRPC